MQEVVRVTVVAGPAQHAHLVLAGLHALAILAPFEALDLGLDADLGQISLHQFGDALGVRVVGPLHRHRPQVGGEPVRKSRCCQQFLRGGRIEGVVLDRVVVGPLGRRYRVLGRDATAEVDRVDDGLLVDRHVDRLANPHIVKRLLGRVVGQVADVQAGLFEHGDLGVLAHRVEVRRVGVGHHMALALLQLGPAYRRVGRDREHQVVNLGLAGVILGKGLVADDRVLLVLHQVKRTRANRLLVDLLGRSGLEHRVSVFLGLNAGVFHRPA